MSKGLRKLINGSSSFEQKLIKFLSKLDKNDTENAILEDTKQYETVTDRGGRVF